MQTHEEALAEFIESSRDLLDKESPEDYPPPAGPYDRAAVPVPSAFMPTPDLIRRYAHAIGEANPLYTDPAYGERSWYGSQIAPGPMLIHVRYPGDHGAQRPQGYPLANFLSGVAWEFYDVVRPGMRFSSSKTPRELIVSRGKQAKAVSHHSETFYWDNSGALLGKAYGRLIHMSVEQMGATRVMPTERLGERLFYDRTPHQYSAEEITRLRAALDDQRWRGAEHRYWEDVREGDALPDLVQPPYSMGDELTYQAMDHGLLSAFDGTRMVRAFRPAYRRGVSSPDFARTHPVTGWPYAPWDEHEDRFLSPYRCEPLPFDFGIQRAQMPIRLLTNWAGDFAFVHRMYTSMRRPVFYGDAVTYQGRVINKYVAEKTDEAGGIVPYAAVAVEITGRNQRDEVHCLGYGTVFLPSRTLGGPTLPVPHPRRPTYVPFDVHRRADWF